MSYGKILLKNSFSVPHLPPICGVIELVNQVSNTSFSPINPFGFPLESSLKPRGVSSEGSIGKSETSGKIGLLKSGSKFKSSLYHNGNGTPKKRCLLIHQSILRFSVQFSNLLLMKSGCQSISLDFSSNIFFLSKSFTNHCLVLKISKGVLLLS